MKNTRFIFAIIVVASLSVSSCLRSGKQDTRTLTLAINSGVEGDALKQAAKDYEQQSGIHINIAEFPYANLFEKELIDLNARTGAYDFLSGNLVRRRIADVQLSAQWKAGHAHADSRHQFRRRR